jgi:hypothetical protein
MPPRYATLAIVALWLGTTCWMAYRDLLPRLRSGEPPPFTIDLTDELSLPDNGNRRDRGSRFSAQAVAWQVELQGRNEAAGQKIGDALTTVLRHEDRTYELQGRLVFNDKGKEKLRVPLVSVEISSLTSSYHVSGDGDLQGIALKMVLSDKDNTGVLRMGPGVSQVEIGMEGDVKDGRLWPHAMLYERAKGQSQDAYVKKELDLKLKPVPIPPRGTVLNTVQPLNRITGLHEGQSWRVPRIDPLEYVLAMLGWGGAPGEHYLVAEVRAASFPYADKDVACWRIDYAEAGGKVSARTWVRQDNGLVLQQEAGHKGMRLVLRRDPRR